MYVLVQKSKLTRNLKLHLNYWRLFQIWYRFVNLNCLIDITNSDNLIIFTFQNFKVDLKHISSISEKLEFSQISKFLSFKMIRSSSFDKN